MWNVDQVICKTYSNGMRALMSSTRTTAYGKFGRTGPREKLVVTFVETETHFQDQRENHEVS